MRWDLILYKTGFSFFFFSLLLIFPMMLDIFLVEGHWQDYLMMIAILLFFGASLILANHGALRSFNLKETFVVIILILIIACITGAMPFIFIVEGYGFTNGLFESIASLTTTAATLIKDFDPPQSLILWKAILHLLGGIGALIYVMIFLPILKIGGMHIYNAGGVNLSGKLLPNADYIIWHIIRVYGALTIICVGCFMLLGMGPFDAIVHGFSTVSTSGFSPHEGSIGYFDSVGVEFAVMFFCALNALPFLIVMSYFQRTKSLELMRDPQVPYYFMMIAVFFLLFFVWAFSVENLKFLYSIRQSLFLTFSALTTSGFFITNIAFLSPFASLLLLFAVYMGGCAGSTAGGVKMMRLIVVGKIMSAHFKKLRFRKAVFSMKYGRRVIDGPLIHNVMGFLCLYVVTNTFVSIALSIAGMDFISSLSIAASAISNYGLALGDTTATMGEYNFLNTSEKWIVMLAMLLGRLDILAFFVLINIRYSLKNIRTNSQ